MTVSEPSDFTEVAELEDGIWTHWLYRGMNWMTVSEPTDITEIAELDVGNWTH